MQNKIFNTSKGLGTLVSWQTVTSSSTTKWGDETKTYGTATSIEAVPFNMFDKEQDLQPFGDLETGRLVMVFKYDQSLSIDDRITFDDDIYLVKRIEKFPLKGGFVVKMALLFEEI